MAPRRPIYLDHHATTPLDPRVLAAMEPYLKDDFGNAASRTHAYGWRAKADLLLATQHVTTVPSYRPFRPHVPFDDADSPAYSGFTPRRLHTCSRAPRRPPVRVPQPQPVPPSGRRTKLGVMMSPLDSHGLMIPTLGSPISRAPPADGGGLGWSAAVESKSARPSIIDAYAVIICETISIPVATGVPECDHKADSPSEVLVIIV